MYGSFQVPEKQFLTEMVVREHNFQTGSQIEAKDTLIYSVAPPPGYTHAWEINNRANNDTLRLHLCANIETADSVGEYSLEVRPIFRPGQLGDEVFVYRGSIDNAHTRYRGYRFFWIDQDFSDYPILIQTVLPPITLVDGSFIALV